MPSAPPPSRPTVCLTMIVRDEAHIIREALDAAAERIDRWVIVDTGSTDDTIAVIEQRMAEHGIPGEIHRRPWRDFGTNRTEALRLADGQADYLWVLDADDTVEGDLDLSGLTADSYLLRYRVGSSFWRRQIFRSGLPWRYEGVLHEYPVCDAPASEQRLEGNYVVHGRKLGARSANPRKYLDDAALLRRVLERDPDDLRSWFYLGQSLADGGDDAGALEAYTRRAELGGWDEERCLALVRRADLLLRLDRPWAEALESLLEAYEARPTRAEPLLRIARHYREQGKFQLGYAFARRAAAMPYPTGDNLFVDAGAYAWAARDEQAVCASYVGRPEEAVDLGTALLASSALPESQRERVATNRDRCVAAIREARAGYPAERARELARTLGRPAADGEPERDTTVVVRATGDERSLERTLNSLLHCVTDLDRVARVVCVCGAAGTAVPGQAFAERHPAVELLRVPADEDDAAILDRTLDTVTTRYLLYVEAGWELFARGSYVDRAARLIEADPTIAQVAFNRSYARSLAERHLVGGTPREVDGGRYRIHVHVDPDGDDWSRLRERMPDGARTNAHWPHFTRQPSLVDVARVREVGRFDAGGDVERAFAARYTAAGWRTAFFDEVSALPAGDADAAVPATAPAPPALARIARGARIGDLDLRLEHPGEIVDARIDVDGEDLRLALQIAPEIDEDGADGGGPADERTPQRVRIDFGPGLRPQAIVPLAHPFVGGPWTVPFGSGELVGETLDGGTHRFVRRAPGTDDAATGRFTVAGTEDERLLALAWYADDLLAAFAVDGERVVVAVLPGDEAQSLFVGVGAAL